MVVPCDCCPTGEVRCGAGEAAFASVSAINPGGLPITNLASTIDGTAGTDLSGFSPPVTQAQLNANPTTAFDYVFTAPVNGLVRLRWHNGGGGVLTDQDGFGLVQVTFLDAGLSPIASLPWDLGPPVGDNNPVRELNFGPFDGVDRVRFGSFNKQSAILGAGSPLLRQVEAFNRQRVFACRRRAGATEWYDELGNLVPVADVGDCGPCVPGPADLTLFSQAVNTFVTGAGADAPTVQETFFNLSIPPTTFGPGTVFVPASNGYGADATAPLSGACGGRDMTLTWAAIPCDVGLGFSFGSNNPAAPLAGGIISAFSSPSTGPITFPANPTPMVAGSVRFSNPLPNGTRLRLSLLAGPSDNNGARAGDIAICTTPAGNVGFHLAGNSTTDHTYRVDFVA